VPDRESTEEFDDEAPERPRSFWSGSIVFGLVNVPVSLFVASRSTGASLRMVTVDGTQLNRRYFCSREDRPVESDEIVRGFEVEKDQFVVIDDEELAALAPEKSQEIDLRRFVPLSQIDPMYFERAYFLAPDKGASKAYRLLARIMEDSERAGIATFVMRGKEYLVAIIAERGVLRAETLRFHDELRSPDDVGLPAPGQAPAQRVAAMTRAIETVAAETLDRDAVRDAHSRRLRELAERKLAAGEDVVAAPDDAPSAGDEGAEVVDLMQVLKQSLVEEEGSPPGEPARRKAPAKAPRRPTRVERADLEERPKAELYERARELGITGRSAMSKADLIDAICARR
jgi:DNA end-binding protein Ku